VLDIFLAGPNKLHGSVDVFGDFDSASDAVRFEPAAKPTADQMIV
jgi:hypothetical protein